MSSRIGDEYNPDTVKGIRWIVLVIGAVSGVCFGAIAAGAISVLATSPHFFRLSSLVFAIVAGCLSYVAFRAATSGRTDEEAFVRALAGGLAGAVIALVVVIASYVMFRQATRAYFAHPIGLRFPQVSNVTLVAALLWLGFAAGFVLRIDKPRDRHKLQ